MRTRAKRQTVATEIHPSGTDSVPGVRVLLVEDDEIDRMAFERFVCREGLGYEVAVAQSLAEARDALERQSFDVILADLHLSDGDGIELLEIGSAPPVIVVTGAGDETTAVRAMRAGAFDYLIKDRERRYLDLVPVTIEKARRYLHAALHDDLTGLPNRVLFVDRLCVALARSRRRGHELGVIFLDLDRFKRINDSLGHRVGDRLLRAITERLEHCLREGDTLARLGGDEFAVLVEEVDDFAEVDAVAEHLHAALVEPFELDGHEVFTGASLGIVLSSSTYEAAEDLLRDADIAMYRAKAEGKVAGSRRRVTFEPDMHREAVAALALESELRRAVEREQLEMHFQPIIDLADGRLAAFEALVRWRHPERGLLMPGEFLPIAQETELSAELGWWVLAESCRRLAGWSNGEASNAAVAERAADIAVSVNLDARQLASPRLVERVEGVLEATGLEAWRLRLEITEGMIIHDAERAGRVLGRLRRRGIGLHIDDFGTGYSSLSQLKTFPVDALKIDRSFVMRMLEQDDDAEIVRAIAQLGRNLRLQVMAEGIETVEHLERVRALGCDYAQGYLFARPLAGDVVPDWLARSEPLPGFGARQCEGRCAQKENVDQRSTSPLSKPSAKTVPTPS